MSSRKAFLALVSTLVLIVSQISAARAAGLTQDGTITGTIQSITLGTLGGNQVVRVIVKLADGTTQTVNLSISDAEKLGLVTVNPDASVTINSDKIGQPITIDPGQILTDPCADTAGAAAGPSAGGANQPVGHALAKFFCGSLGASYTMIQEWHMEGLGYGVIAEALFMAQILGGNSTLAEEILVAKQTHDFSGLTLPDASTPKNWGQLMKDVLGSGLRSMTNLGAIMSGRVTPPTLMAPSLTTNHGKSGSHGGGNGHGNGNGHRP